MEPFLLLRCSRSLKLTSKWHMYCHITPLSPRWWLPSWRGRTGPESDIVRMLFARPSSSGIMMLSCVLVGFQRQKDGFLYWEAISRVLVSLCPDWNLCENMPRLASSRSYAEALRNHETRPWMSWKKSFSTFCHRKRLWQQPHLTILSCMKPVLRK